MQLHEIERSEDFVRPLDWHAFARKRPMSLLQRQKSLMHHSRHWSTGLIGLLSQVTP